MRSFPKRYADAVARLRVPGGFLLVAAFAWFSQPSPISLAAGLPIAMAGLGLRAWAAGCLAKDQQLARGGPYAHTRNPLYVGTLLVATGLAVSSRSIGLGLLFATVFGLVYLPVIQLEEQHLRSLFPEYAEYATAVPPLWPRIRGIPAECCFRWSRYGKNREYQAALGLVLGALFLFWKVMHRVNSDSFFR